MAYQALYRKWRPSVFEDVVGQNHIVETLKNQINTKKIAHAYLFCGSRGTGKTSTAKIFSRAVNCKNPINGNPCNECEACRGILNGSIFDVVEIDGASNNKVDDVRAIRDEVVYPPADLKYKVYIIDEVHMLSTEAFNALLKTLEEPPEYIIFILATTEFHKIPATIISRCQKFDFKRITYKDTAARIKKVAENDDISVTDSAVKLLAKAADGSLRDGLSKLDQCLALGKDSIDYKDVAEIIGASDPEFLLEFCDAVIDENLGHALKLLDDGVNMGVDPMRLYTDVTDYFRDLLMIKTSKDYSLIVNTEDEVLKRYEEQAKRVTLSRILKIIETLFDGQSMAKYLTSPKLSFETSLLKIASKSTDSDVESLLERINILEEKLDELSKGGYIRKEEAYGTNSFEEEKIAKKEDYEEPIPVTDTELSKEDDEEYVFEDENDEESFGDFSFPGEYDVKLKEESIEIQPQDEILNDIENIDEIILETDFLTEINSSLDENEENFLNVSNEPETVLSVFDNNREKEEIKKENNEELENIVLNFKEFTSRMKNKDMGFDSIVKSAGISVEGETLILEFENKTSFDIAKSNKYDALIEDAAKELNSVDIFVKLKYTSEKYDNKNDIKDPLDDLIKIAEENQIIFNFED